MSRNHTRHIVLLLLSLCFFVETAPGQQPHRANAEHANHQSIRASTGVQDVPSSQPSVQARAVRPHFGLLFSEEDIPRMRANAQLPQFADYWEQQLNIDFEADNNFFREAFIYVITGDLERGQSAREAVLAMAEEEYWNDFVQHDPRGNQRLGFLKAGRVTAWMALAYDWMYDLFSESEREQIRLAIAEKGCVPLYRSLYGFKYPNTVPGWSFAPYAPVTPRYDLDMSRWPHILANNNFRAIINGGLTLGTIVLEGQDDRTPAWKEMVLESIGLFNDLLKDDGSYDEAVNYLNYAMTYQLHAMEGARRIFGVDYFDTANFQGMMDYVLSMYLPTDLYGHGSITFGDAGNSLRSPAAFWVASNARDGLAQYIALNYSDHDPLSLLYYDESVKPTGPGTSAYLVELDLDWIISRNGYQPQDFVLGMRSGDPMNHEHGDRNSILLKAHNEILLADHRRLSYWALDPEWEMRGSRGHNTVLIDGVGHQYHNGEEGTNESKSHAKIVRSGDRNGYHFWASDATQGYQLLNEDVKSVTRSVISFPDASALIVLDKVMKFSEPSVVSSRWHAENFDGQGDVSARGRSFEIRRPNATLHAVTGGTSVMQSSTGVFDSANKEHPFRFVESTAADAQLESLSVTAGVVVPAGEADPDIKIDRDGSSWVVRISTGDSEIEVNVSNSGSLPEFQVVRSQ